MLAIKMHDFETRHLLRVLNTALEPLQTSAGIAELRDRLTSAAA